VLVFSPVGHLRYLAQQRRPRYWVFFAIKFDVEAGEAGGPAAPGQLRTRRSRSPDFRVNADYPETPKGASGPNCDVRFGEDARACDPDRLSPLPASCPWKFRQKSAFPKRELSLPARSGHSLLCVVGGRSRSYARLAVCHFNSSSPNGLGRLAHCFAIRGVHDDVTCLST
jgi:hypothetical protein